MKKILITAFVVFAIFELYYRASAATSQPFVQGNEAINIQYYPAVSQITVATNVPVSPTATYMHVLSTGGQVTFATNSSWPAISTSTALNGQLLILDQIAVNVSSTIVIATGSATGVIGGDQYIVISGTKSAAEFIFNSSSNVWVEVGKQY